MAMADPRKAWRSMGLELRSDVDGPATSDIWCPEYECMPRDELRALQLRRAEQAYRLLWSCSDFYRLKFERAGLNEDSLDSWEAFRKIPITHRSEWLIDQDEHPPYGSFSPLRQEDWISRGWMLFTTSGTSAGSPRSFRHTTHDRDLWTWHGARALYAMGIRKGDIALNAFGYGTWVAFWGLHYALNHMGVPVIPGGGSNTERRARFIDRYLPTVLLCTPSYALYLGRSMQELGLSPEQSSIRLLVCAGEPGPCVPGTKRRLETLWGAKINDDFGCTEVAMSPFGYTCKEQVNRDDGHVDVHLMEDGYIVEALSPDTWEPVSLGEKGVLVVSNLYSEAQPILRYVMGDWITVTEDPCLCGRTHARAVGGLQGRHDLLVKIRGLMFFPAALEDAVRSQERLGDEYKIEIQRVDDIDRVFITAEPSADVSESEFSELQPIIERSLKGMLGIEVNLTLVTYGTLPRTEFKAKRLFDLRAERKMA